MGARRAVMASPCAWIRWVVGVLAYGVAAVAVGLMSPDGGWASDALFATVAIILVVAWPVDARCRRGVAAQRVGAGLVYVTLALPIWVVATRAGGGVTVASHAVRAALIVAAWGFTVASWPAAGVWAAVVSIALTGVTSGGEREALRAIASAPRAFAGGVAPTLAHVSLMASVATAGMCREWLRTRLTSN